MLYLGFSGHAPVPFDNDWLTPEADLSSYLSEIRGLRERYAGRIAIFVGLEVDYLPGVISPASPHIRDLGLDHVIGSVHFLGRHPGGRYWTVDHNHEETVTGIAASFGGSVEEAVREYYRRIGDMAVSTRPDIIGHFDIVKKFSADKTGPCLFSESAAWYREAVCGALDAVASSGSIVEVNTGALGRGITTEAYPSSWILQECRKREIPAMMSCDAHRPEELLDRRETAADMLRSAGYTTHTLLTPEGWRSFQL